MRSEKNENSQLGVHYPPLHGGYGKFQNYSEDFILNPYGLLTTRLAKSKDWTKRWLHSIERRCWAFRHGGPFSRISWSQEAEDLILDKYLKGRKFGFYVDVGAHHPARFSNTKLFYIRGWRGLNIDAMPGSMEAFEKDRPRCINLQVGVAATAGELTYYRYDEPALNGFVRNAPEIGSVGKRRVYQLIGSEKVSVLPLADILDQHLPEGKKIDFLTVDVEGLDLVVLQSNNWYKYRPEYVVVELDCFELETAIVDECYIFLRSQGYNMYAKTGKSVIFGPATPDDKAEVKSTKLENRPA